MHVSSSGVIPRILWWNPAWFTVVAAVALSLLGLAAISTTEAVGESHFFKRQLVFLFVGLFAMGAVAIPNPRLWKSIAYPLAVLVVLLLLFVLVPYVPDWLVRPKNGARRWINLQILDFQPSEIGKIALVLALANYLRLRKNYRTLMGLLVPFAIMLLPTGLILVEPDLGSSLLFPVALFAMLLAAGAKLKHLSSIAGLGLVAAFLVAFVSLVASNQETPTYPVLEKHQVERIQGLVNQVRGDRKHADTINYQSFKAMILVGSGGVTGLGSERSKVIVEFNRLPFDYNDMIFAVIANRWGFMGSLVLILIYLVYIAGMVTVAGVTRNPFSRLVCVGFATIVVAQMGVNIGMTIGLLPITGMTLPFVSYGGSSLVANYLMVGIVLGIGLRPPRNLVEQSFEFDGETPEPDPLDRLRV